jgi:hypothetical protein
MAALDGRAHHDNHDVLATLQISIPARKQSRAPIALAASDLVWIGKCGGDQIPMLRYKVRMVLCDMPLPFRREFYGSLQVRT